MFGENDFKIMRNFSLIAICKLNVIHRGDEPLSFCTGNELVEVSAWEPSTYLLCVKSGPTQISGFDFVKTTLKLYVQSSVFPFMYI